MAERVVKILHVKPIGAERTFCGLKHEPMAYGTKLADDWRLCHRCKPHSRGLMWFTDHENRFRPLASGTALAATSTNGTVNFVISAVQTSTGQTRDRGQGRSRTQGGP